MTSLRTAAVIGIVCGLLVAACAAVATRTDPPPPPRATPRPMLPPEELSPTSNKPCTLPDPR